LQEQLLGTPDDASFAGTGELAAGFMSVASVFINKAIFHVYDFKFPYTLVFGQTLFTLVLLTVMRSLHIIRMAPFQFAVLHKVRGKTDPGRQGWDCHAAPV